MGSNVATVGNRGAVIIGGPNLAPTFGYGATPIAAAVDTGPILAQQASGWRNWVLSFIIAAGAGTGYTVTWYGTIDPATAYGVPATAAYGASAANWIQLPAPAVETTGDTSLWTNPQTVANTAVYCNAPFVAIRANVAASAQSGSILLLAYATQ